jgi:hypothetical protein
MTLWPSCIISPSKGLITNLHHRTFTVATMMNAQFKKKHFIGGLCSVDPSFPLKLWDKLLPQATITLNLLLKSRINPRISAYAQLNGHYDFNRPPPWRPPLAPISLHMRNHTNRPLGTLMALMDTTWAHLCITTDVTKSTSHKQGVPG